MEIRNGEAEAGVSLEAARGGEHPDSWWFEWVLRREDKGAPVLAVVIGGVGGASEEVVPPRRVRVSSLFGGRRDAWEDVYIL